MARLCDVLVMKLCDDILGRPWLADRDVPIHIYTVVTSGCTYTRVTSMRQFFVLNRAR